MNVVLDYDAHCEKEEQEVPQRKEKEELDTYNMIQSRLNNKVSNIMKGKDSLKLIAKGIKPLMTHQSSSGYESQGYKPYMSGAVGGGYESPTSGKK